MLTKVVLKNFKSYDGSADEKDENKKGIRYSNVYGHHGSDRNPLIDTMQLLDDLINTMNVRKRYEEFLTEGFVFRNKKKTTQLEGLWDIASIIKDYSQDAKENPMSAYYEFSVGENTGSYYIELGESEILHEKLICKKQDIEITYYDFQNTSIMINPSIASNRGFLADICLSAAKFWGKHSMLAILNYEIEDKAESYGKACVANEMKDVMNSLSLLSGQLSIGTTGIEELRKQYVFQKNTDEETILLKSCFVRSDLVEN